MYRFFANTMLVTLATLDLWVWIYAGFLEPIPGSDAALGLERCLSG